MYRGDNSYKHSGIPDSTDFASASVNCNRATNDRKC